MLQTYPQVILVLIFLSFGIIIGLILGLINFILIMFKNNKFLQIITDIISCLGVSILYIYLINNFNWGEHRFFLIVFYLTGLILERKTIGKLFAKFYYKLYTIIAMKINKLEKTKFGAFIKR